MPVAVIGQAFPYTPIANPRHFVPDWTFGIQEEALQKHVDAARAKGAQVVVLLSHNGMDVDLKLASRVRGIDAMLGGHTHDAVPQAAIVENAGGSTIVTNARLERQIPRRARSRRARRTRRRLPLPLAAGVREPAARRPGDGGAHRGLARAARSEARREARGDRGAPLPARQLQRHVRPADPGGDAGGQGRADRVLAGLPVGHDRCCPARRSRWSTCSTRPRSPIRSAR